MLHVIIIEEQKKDISLMVEYKETKKMLFKSDYELLFALTMALRD